MNPEKPPRTSPNLRHLAAALEISRHGSISRATKQIHLSQSAITQALAKLEKQLDLQLFTRSANGLFATDGGEIFLSRIERAFEWLKLVDGLIEQGSQRKGTPLYRTFTTTQLRALITVVEQGNYTLAANRLHLTQPTVHRAVKELETVCNLRFFQRSPAGVEASWKARQVARYASLFFSELAQGIEEVNEHRGQMTGSLRVGSLPLARTRMVPQGVTRLLEEFPQARISIIDGPYEEQLHSLLHGQLDIIVGALREPSPSPDIEQKLLFSDPLYLVVRPEHPLADRAARDAEELRDLDWIAPREHTPAREAFTRFFASEGLRPPEHIVECSSMVAIRGLLLESNRVALLPARQVEVEVDMGLLAISPQKLAGTSRNIGLAVRKNWVPTRIQQRFIELIQDR
jgi:DNA-binding transcriptional LysR family regulator|tara:strand:- start:2436 stop:3641 length:1206 start_codon:yes stop_codon:yes gene_type:complete